MKYAILADLHLTDTLEGPKHLALSWAMARIREIQPDALVTIGDMTATGKPCQAASILEEIAALHLPHYATPGNAEYRSNNMGCVNDFTQDAPLPLLLVDSAKQELSEKEMQKILALPDQAHVLLATHSPVEQWPEDQQQVVRAAQKRQAITAVIAGHSHNDGETVMRGLDPDKATGGVPAFEIWEQLPDGTWSRSREEMPGVDPSQWSPEERQNFCNCLGISCMYDCLGNLASATELKIKNIELRATAVFETDAALLLQAINRWRQAVPEGCLSLHATNLTVENTTALEHSVQMALTLNCDRITLHVPAVTAALFPSVKQQLVQNLIRLCSPLLERKIKIGIENLHTRPPKELTPETRNYGCNILECWQWIQTLQKATHSPLIGFHLDIGHARNNSPFSAEEYVSDWMTHLGAEINGMHLHQVVQAPDGSFKNHQKITGFYTKLISLSGLFLAYRSGLIPQNTPMFLEISEEDAGIECWQSLIRQFPLS